MYISFKNCKVVVFWTKNPKPILPYLHELDERGIHYYFQVTLNDYVKEGFEPHVSSVDDRVETFKKLSDMIGKEKVIWRFDPLIITPNITPRDLLTRIWHIGNKLKGYTNKLVFSFVDVKAYRKVQNNLVKETAQLFTKEDVENAEANNAQQIEIVEGLKKIREAWKKDGWDIKMATCAEDIDLEAYGIEHNRCIDGELMKRIFADDEELVYYLYTLKLPERDIFGQFPPIPAKEKIVKDSGQRKICGCMVSKDIGMYNTCRHFCVYCYANTSKECVLKNKVKHNDESESIIE
jgi:DNA repair photolyase